MLLSHLRTEEKKILAAAAERGIEVVRVYRPRGPVRSGRSGRFPDVDLVLDRSLVHSRAEYTLRLLAALGHPDGQQLRRRASSATTSSTRRWPLSRHGVPTLRTTGRLHAAVRPGRDRGTRLSGGPEAEHRLVGPPAGEGEYRGGGGGGAGAQGGAWARSTTRSSTSRSTSRSRGAISASSSSATGSWRRPTATPSTG